MSDYPSYRIFYYSKYKSKDKQTGRTGNTGDLWTSKVSFRKRYTANLFSTQINLLLSLFKNKRKKSSFDKTPNINQQKSWRNSNVVFLNQNSQRKNLNTNLNTIKKSRRKNNLKLWLSTPITAVFLLIFIAAFNIRTSAEENDENTASTDLAETNASLTELTNHTLPQIEVFYNTALRGYHANDSSAIFDGGTIVNADNPDVVISPDQIDDNISDPDLEGAKRPYLENQTPQNLNPQEIAWSFNFHKVQTGETLWKIAKRYNLRIDTLVSANDLDPLKVLEKDLELKLPRLDGLYYRVQKGDSYKKIASTYQLSFETIRKFNGNSDYSEELIRPGKTLFLPGAMYEPNTRRLLFGKFFQLPAEGILTSNYGFRIHPIKKIKLFHAGIDIGANTGTAVKASASGKVITAGEHGSYGNCISIKHSQGYQTTYAHLDSISVRAGQSIKQGQIIGRVGNTGLSTGPHLHFEIKQNGRYINPKRFLQIKEPVGQHLVSH